MNNKPDDMLILSAYIDRELPESERQAIEQRLAEDDELRAIYSRLQRSEQAYRQGVFAIDAEPLPPVLTRMLLVPDKSRGKVISLFTRPVRHGLQQFGRPGLAAAAAMVAVTALFFLQDRQVNLQPALPSLTEVRFDSGNIVEALGSMVAGTTMETDVGELTEVLAFSRRDGVLCKHIILRQGGDAMDAVACYEDGGWARLAMDPPSAGASAEGKGYQVADGAAGPHVESYIQTVIDGTSHSPAQERDIMKNLGLAR